MKTSKYQTIKSLLLDKLIKTGENLSETDIEKAILDLRKLSDTASFNDVLKALTGISSNDDDTLTDKDWEKMKRELEVHLNIKMDKGFLVQGEDQQKRDNTWWSNAQKQKGENYYWNRYKVYIKRKLPPQVVKTIDTDTDIVMNNLGDPLVENFNRYGMVVGHVQSGKTGNYSALICKAADAGYKFIVVIAGGTNNLRNQTQGRINQAFVGKDKGKLVGVGHLAGVARERTPISLTTAEQDFNNQDANKNSQALNFENISTPIVVVIKKHSRAFTNVIKWLEAHYKNEIEGHSMLLIDDESDYASINTKKEEDPTGINKLTRKLLSLFRKSVYVAYTATPYANIFIDHEAGTNELGDDLFPKDFIYALHAPKNYFGASKIFQKEDSNYVVEIDDFADDLPLHHKKEHEIISIPESLKDAIRLFVINIAIRSLREKGNSHNSMLVHASRFTNIHQKLGIEIEDYLESIQKEINAYGKLPKPENKSQIIEDIKITLNDQLPDIEFNWSNIINAICLNVGSIVVREVHQRTTLPLEYRNDRPTNAIAIGGASLSRGYTLEGLSVSYFLRNSIYYDTLMQMGRWFGYRLDYEDICRIYMPSEIRRRFTHIIDATQDLFSDFKRMSNANKTPYDFGLCVRQHPDSLLQVTARNKQKNAQIVNFKMQLGGRSKETAWLSNSSKHLVNNLNAIKQIVKRLKQKNTLTRVGKHALWKDVEKDIVKEFLNTFQTYQENQYGLGMRMPIEFIKQYIIDDNRRWDVALYGGKGAIFEINADLIIQSENRKITNKGEYFQIAHRQVSAGNAETIGLSEADRNRLGSDRKETRAIMKKPLLMLHILNDEDEKIGPLAAFGVSFPGSVDSERNVVTHLVNSVYIKNIADQLNYEEAYEDE